jgi:hypothetical protein
MARPSPEPNVRSFSPVILSPRLWWSRTTDLSILTQGNRPPD